MNDVDLRPDTPTTRAEYATYACCWLGFAALAAWIVWLTVTSLE